MKWNNLGRRYEDRLAAMRKLAPHELLGVRQGCSLAEMRVAYLALIKTYHPDRADPFIAQYSEEMLKIINDAYAKMRERARK